ncbi:hypothetical protein BU23DRAFT_213994 [Bimuria novae-zelandiae CBS 107.79]|uniref:Uncharacterized protein n=1 Tax=Bimuria novae-zelandiae CBS 107.79 TaxID=1447943 RepID=A0A6A5UYQ9_9PLEO|nr:hypothetical protein BU23DRAFT_213994 [Bimuria novae-zelandiae CBS 107.79]
MSLGGDSRLRTGAGEMRHNGDIADRNVERYGSMPSRETSLKGRQASGASAQADYNVWRKSVAASIESLGSPDSARGSLASLSPKYTLGSGVPTKGSLIDGILPHFKDPQALPYNRKKWPTRAARDESKVSTPRRKRHGSDDFDKSDTKHESSGRRKDKSGLMDLQEAIGGGPEGHNNGLRANLDGVMDLRDTKDVDKETRWVPEVVHETVKPHEHEIIEERIYREIHNHDVYHYIQPVYETEILPARHFGYSSNNELVEVPAEKLPECTGANQRWSIVRDREKPNTHVIRSLPRSQGPKIISDETFTTPEGFERRETTWLHPPGLEDMSNYDGLVLPIPCPCT